MYQASEEEFEQMVEDALEHMPKQFMDQIDNVCFTVQDEPDEQQLRAVAKPNSPNGTYGGGELLGLYSGINIQERAKNYDMDLPDMITIFKGPHERVTHSHEQMAREVERTVIHEIGHYFGLDDKRLREMGY